MNWCFVFSTVPIYRVLIKYLVREVLLVLSIVFKKYRLASENESKKDK